MSQATTSAESTMLLRYLNAQREHILGILDDLDETALRCQVLPSGWSCLGLVRHLALDVERFWFRAVVAADQTAIDDLPDNPWNIDAEISAPDVFDLYRQEIERANAIIAATPLEAPPAWWPEGLFGDWKVENLRQIILHVMTETATHAGHLDIVREQIDGRQWLVLTD
jgi:uncharacterized damage-inducible protein DinB